MTPLSRLSFLFPVHSVSSPAGGEGVRRGSSLGNVCPCWVRGTARGVAGCRPPEWTLSRERPQGPPVPCVRHAPLPLEQWWHELLLPHRWTVQTVHPVTYARQYQQNLHTEEAERKP